MEPHGRFCLLIMVLMPLVLEGVAVFRPEQQNLFPRPTTHHRPVHRQELSTPVRTLLIDNYDSYTYNIRQLIAEVNGEEPVVVYNDAFGGSWETMLQQVPEFDNIVLSPGPGSPDKPEDFGLCMDAILKSDVPLLGVCLGHQGLAYAYGGSVVRAPYPVHGRLSPVAHNGNGIFSDVDMNANVVRYHSLIAQHPLPDVLRVTAWTSPHLSSSTSSLSSSTLSVPRGREGAEVKGDIPAEGLIMALEHKHKPQYGVQFHPESIKTAAGRRIFSNFRDITRNLHLPVQRHSPSARASHTEDSSSSSSSSSSFKPSPSKQNRSSNYNTAIISNKKNRNIIDTASRKVTRHAHVVSIHAPASSTSATTEAVFQALYGAHAAAFWLDSQSPGPVEVYKPPPPTADTADTEDVVGEVEGMKKKNRLSFMGAIDAPGAYSVEYNGKNRLVRRSHSTQANDGDHDKFSDDDVHLRGSDGDTYGNSENGRTDNVVLEQRSIFQFLREQLRREEDTDTQLSQSNYTLTSSTSDSSSTTLAAAATAPSVTIPFNLTGTLFGYLGYEVGYEAAQIQMQSKQDKNGQYDVDVCNMSTSRTTATTCGESSTREHDRYKDTTHPEALLMYPSRFVVFDHDAEMYHIVAFQEEEEAEGGAQNDTEDCDSALVRSEKAAHELAEKVNTVLVYSPQPPSSSSSCSAGSAAVRSGSSMRVEDVEDNEDNEDNEQEEDSPAFAPVMEAKKSKTEYKRDIASCLDSITAGETYEVCLTLPFSGPYNDKQHVGKTKNVQDGELETCVQLETYKRLRKINVAPYACYIRYDPVAAFSPPPATMTTTTTTTTTAAAAAIITELKKDSGSSIGSSSSAKKHQKKEKGDPEWYAPGGFTLCSTSPECFLKISEEGLIQSKPIKGTAKRDLEDATKDENIAETLKNDEKSQAENLMIVDLVRNDLGRVCEVGSVGVPRGKLMDIESYSTVHQMVTTVAGRLKSSCDVVDALVATFPGGSMTGAPKVRTMRIIEELEAAPRGVYSGTIGYIGLNGAADLNIVIRTALIANETITIGAGGAIVAMSDPEEEVEEVLLKARSVSRALGYTVQFKQEDE